MNVFRTKIGITDGCPLSIDCTVCENDSIKCSPKGAVYMGECMDCYNRFNAEEREEDTKEVEKKRAIYIGESSRPLRMRINEHREGVKQLKEDSFIINHWMQAHGTEMTPPDIEFRRIASYRDCLTRQISEALHIEVMGNLNRKSEFGTNHLARLESSWSQWDKERQAERDAEERANWKSNLKCFIDVIYNVRKHPSITTTNHSSSTFRKRVNNTEDLRGVVESKRRRRIESSTPIWRHRERKEEETDISPIAPSRRNIGNDPEGVDSSQGSLGEGFSHMECSGVAGLSPELRKMLLQPRNENEYTESKRLITETINLTRAAMLSGILERGDMTLWDVLEENSLFKPYFTEGRRNSLSKLLRDLDLEEWEKEDIYVTFGINRPDGSHSSILVEEMDGFYDEKEEERKDTDANEMGEALNGRDVVDIVCNDHSLLPATPTSEIQRMRGGDAPTDSRKVLKKIFVDLSLPPATPTSEIKYMGGGGIISSSAKRKKVSPTGETIIKRALKLRKGNSPNSPVLRSRKVIERKKMTQKKNATREWRIE